jgi:hypothetical protein
MLGDDVTDIGGWCTMKTLSRADHPTRASAKARAAAVITGVLAALIVWALAKLAVHDLRQPAFGPATPQELSAAVVAGAALTGALLGWSSLAIVERRSGRGRTLWLRTVLVALLLSLGSPLSGHGISAGNRMVLVLLHLTVAAVVIPLLYRTSPPGRRPQAEHP